MQLAYRKDLDGLRALAILPVLFFHLDFHWFSGGYTGVDVFFVLSGYLISSILIKEINNKTFSFGQFFNRRIRRLMPMGFAIYIFCLLVFLFIYPSTYYQKVTDAALTSMLFSSNIYFWQQGGYFTGAYIELNPLLHTWSLSVEEQFYLFFPLFLIILFKLTTSTLLRFLAICMLTLISLFIAVTFAPSSQSFAAFYLLPPRIYELAIGAAFAYLVIQSPHHKLRKLPGLKELGFIMVVLPIFMFDEHTSFPSYNALLPVLGAAFIIYANHAKSLVNTLLTNSTVVYIGLISYSLYLWHWPLIVLKNWMLPQSNLWIDILTICLCFILSAWSYNYIEKPFRNKTLVPNPKLIKIASIAFLSLLFITLCLKYYGNGAVVDPDGKIQATYLSATQAEPNRETCTNKIRNTHQFHYCEWQSDNPEAKKIFVWGDSHGSALMPAFDSFPPEYNVRYSNNTGCPPVPNLDRKGHIHQCDNINKLVLEHINNEDYDLIILASAFNNYLNWNLLRTVDSSKSNTLKNSEEILGFNLSLLLSDFEAKNQPFIIVSQPPRFEEDVPLHFLRENTLNLTKSPLVIDIAEYNKQSSGFYRAVDERWHKYIFALDELYCPSGTCISQRSDELLYKDGHHVTNDFAKEIGESLRIFIAKQLNQHEKK